MYSLDLSHKNNPKAPTQQRNRKTLNYHLIERAYTCDHSHKKRKNSLETWAIHTKICMLCWTLASTPKHQGSQGFYILETEGSVQKILKRALFHYKKDKKDTPNLTSHYVHSLFTIVLIKQIFQKNKSSRAASGSWTQF